jgi:hypothetical protein
VWRVAKLFADRKTAEALRHGRWVWDVERALHLPSELTLQRDVIPHSLLTQACNIFYATVHVPAVIAALVWLFLRHRDHYRWVRNNLAVLTAGCLFLQFIPVAPPRMFPELGFIDTGLRYGQSVYGAGGSGESNQLAAMPSIHVGWAVLVAVGVVVASRSRWRWLVLLHPAFTMYAVMVTGNHWWLDGIVAAAILGLSILVLRPPARAELEERRDGDGDVVLDHRDRDGFEQLAAEHDGGGEEHGHEPGRPAEEDRPPGVLVDGAGHQAHGAGGGQA